MSLHPNLHQDLLNNVYLLERCNFIIHHKISRGIHVLRTIPPLPFPFPKAECSLVQVHISNTSLKYEPHHHFSGKRKVFS